MAKLLQLGKIVLTKTYQNVSGKTYKNGAFMGAPKEIFGYLIGGKHSKGTPVNKVLDKTLKAAAKFVNLTQTPLFSPTMLATGAIAGGIGYALGNYNSQDNASIGLAIERESASSKSDTQTTDNPSQVQKQDANVNIQETPIAQVKVINKNNFHSIKTSGMTWKNIVETYYPKLIDQCDGKLYGKDGAIRILKETLSKGDNIDLIKETDIPKILNLPLEINGIKINKNAEKQTTEILQSGGATNIEEAGCKTMKTSYSVRDNSKNKTVELENLNQAVDSLKKLTNIPEYKLNYTN